MKCLFFLFSLACGVLSAQSTHQLYYNQPAKYFEETLVLGNGTMGAAIFGGVDTDSIFLNEATLWSGEPVDPYMNPDAHRHLPEIRSALRNEDYQLADSLNRRLQGKFSQSYMPLGTLHLRTRPPSGAVAKSGGEFSNYHRELDISQAISRTSYTADGVEYTREYFISHPDRVMVIKLSSSEANALNFELGFGSLLNFNVELEGKDLVVHGYAPYHVEPSYRGDIPNTVRNDPKRGTRFAQRVRIKHFDGRTVAEDGMLKFIGGTEAVVLLTLATSFNGFDKDPAREGKNARKLARRNLQSASERTFAELKASHLRDYTSFFDRLQLDLGPTTAPDLPTDERLKRYAGGAEDKNLEVLYAQYGRYLLISSSRTPEVPANLQGIWNPYLRPPWSSNYTTNINAQENYWPAETANLSELHQPLLSFIENLAETGRVSARTFYGTRGWVTAHNSDIWAMSNPVGDFGQGDPNWANWNFGGVWLATHLWEHYLFTRDEEFLRRRAYPIMKGAAQFCLDWFTEGPDGTLVSSPSTSPEAKYITDEGYQGSTLYGATSDMAMARENFLEVIAASEILGADAGFRAEVTTALENLHPYKIGSAGNLQEWYYDWKDADPRHRHQTHLFGLHPGHHLNPEDTPDLLAAARQTLEVKGDNTTGWSKGWRINLWARLRDGDRAYKMYRELLRYVEPDNAPKTEFSGGGGTYPNLFDAHPPFQIDGNFGGAAAVLEMIVQSTPDTIRLLPALPAAWPEGKLRGVCTRSGHVVDLTWENGMVTAYSIHARHGGPVNIIVNGELEVMDLEGGQSREGRLP